MDLQDDTPSFGKLRYCQIGGVEGADRELKVAYRGEYPTASCGLRYLFRKARLVVGVDVFGREWTLKDSSGKTQPGELRNG